MYNRGGGTNSGERALFAELASAAFHPCVEANLVVELFEFGDGREAVGEHGMLPFICHLGAFWGRSQPRILHLCHHGLVLATWDNWGLTVGSLRGGLFFSLLLRGGVALLNGVLDGLSGANLSEAK